MDVKIINANDAAGNKNTFIIKMLFVYPKLRPDNNNVCSHQAPGLILAMV